VVRTLGVRALITFELRGPNGESGSVTLVTPKTWWRRWLLKAAVFLWRVGMEVEPVRAFSRAKLHCPCELHEDTFGCHHEPHPLGATAAFGERCGEWFGGRFAHDYCRRDAGHTGTHSSVRFNADEDESLRG
jgi:hypothetical protein